MYVGDWFVTALQQSIKPVAKSVIIDTFYTSGDAKLNLKLIWLSWHNYYCRSGNNVKEAATVLPLEPVSATGTIYVCSLITTVEINVFVYMNNSTSVICSWLLVSSDMVFAEGSCRFAFISPYSCVVIATNLPFSICGYKTTSFIGFMLYTAGGGQWHWDKCAICHHQIHWAPSVCLAMICGDLGKNHVW